MFAVSATVNALMPVSNSCKEVAIAMRINPIHGRDKPRQARDEVAIAGDHGPAKPISAAPCVNFSQGSSIAVIAASRARDP